MSQHQTTSPLAITAAEEARGIAVARMVLALTSGERVAYTAAIAAVQLGCSFVLREEGWKP